MAQFPGTPWDQRPDYVALTQRVDPAGIVTTYNPPRPGVSATDVTSFIFGQATITMDSWPEVMYYLEPTPEWYAFRSTPRPPQKVDANGQAMVERFPRPGQLPRPLLDFRILPDTICSQEELWWIELWRRMDPRIHWEDIFMRVELPNGTVDSDRKLQNSTNNLINRHEHKRFSMLSWHSTGSTRTNRNKMRNLVLRRVNEAHPPLPPNSTRGLTPGLINPRLGNVPGNSIPFPPLRSQSAGRIRVGGRPRVGGATAAAASNTAQGSLGPGKRRRSSSGPQGRPSKRAARDFRDETSEDDTDNSYNGTKSSEGTPLSEASTRPRAAQTQKRGTRHGPAPKTEKRVSVKGNGQAAGAKSVRGRSTAERHNTTEADHEHQEDHSEQTNLQPFREGDPGFEAAYQASLGSRRQRRSNFRGPPRPANLGRPSRHIPETPPTRLSPQDDVSDSELLGYSEERTLRTATEGSNPPPDPRVPAPPRNLANSPTPSLRRPRTSPMTGLPFEPLNRRPEALSGYSDTTVRRRGSSMSSRVPPSTRTQLSGDNDERTGPTMNPNPSLPTDPANLLSQDYYYRSPGGSYYHDVSPEIPTSATNPWPSSSSGMGVTQNRSNHGRTQPIGQPSQPSGHTQPATQYQNPVNDATDRDDAQPNSLVRRLSEEIRRHENASLAETLRHDHALRRIAMDGGRSDDIAGFLERDNESERREKQGSTDEDNE